MSVSKDKKETLPLPVDEDTIFIIPVFIVAFICAIIMTTAKANNKVPSILGNSIVEVLTDSMQVEGGYAVGDVLIIDQSVDLDSLKVGDCIAFYAPKQSRFTTDGTVNGDSLIIFHRIVRIIYAPAYKNNESISDTPVRHFVCRGDKLGVMTKDNGKLVPTQALLNGETEPGGDYDEFGNITPNGGYVVKLRNEIVATDENQVQSNQSDLQYVTDDFVVGKLKKTASPIISGAVKFCSSEMGIVLLVVIPSMIMIGLIVVNLIAEGKAAIKEREADQLILAKNMSMMNSISGDLDGTQQETALSQNEVSEIKNNENIANEKLDNPTSEKDSKIAPNNKKIPTIKSEEVSDKSTEQVKKDIPKKVPTKSEVPQKEIKSTKKPETTKTANTDKKTAPKTQIDKKVAPLKPQENKEVGGKKMPEKKAPEKKELDKKIEKDKKVPEKKVPEKKTPEKQTPVLKEKADTPKKPETPKKPDTIKEPSNINKTKPNIVPPKK